MSEFKQITVILAILRVAQLPHTFDNSHLSKNSDQKETTTIAYSCRQGQIIFFRPKKKSFLLVAKWHSSPPTVKSNFHLKKHPSTSEDCQVGVGPKLPGYPNWSGLFIRSGFSCTAPSSLQVSGIHENAGKPDDVAGNTLEIRLEITHHNLQERKRKSPAICGGMFGFWS